MIERPAAFAAALQRVLVAIATARQARPPDPPRARDRAAPGAPSTSTLRDGRRLAYSRVGPPDGVLVLYLHGAIGSPQAAGPELEAVVGELGIRYVMVSRPGFGGSDAAARPDAAPVRRRRRAARRHARPRALRRRRRVGGRPLRAGVRARAARARRASRRRELHGRRAAARRAACRRRRAWACAAAPAAARLRPRRRRARAGSPAASRRSLARVMYAGRRQADRRLLDASDARELAAGRFLAATRGGVGGMIDDYVLCSRPWGFEPAASARAFSCGTACRTRSSRSTGDRARRLDAARRRAVHPEEGHFFYRRRMREILGALVAAGSPAGTRSTRSVDQPNPRAPSPPGQRVVVLAKAVARAAATSEPATIGRRPRRTRARRIAGTSSHAVLTQDGPRQVRKRSQPGLNDGSSMLTDGIPTGAR